MGMIRMTDVISTELKKESTRVESRQRSRAVPGRHVAAELSRTRFQIPHAQKLRREERVKRNASRALRGHGRIVVLSAFGAMALGAASQSMAQTASTLYTWNGTGNVQQWF